jgi:hypothetical protein
VKIMFADPRNHAPAGLRIVFIPPAIVFTPPAIVFTPPAIVSTLTSGREKLP